MADQLYNKERIAELLTEEFFGHKKDTPKVLVLGLGEQGGGTGVLKFFRALGWKVTVADLKDVKKRHKGVRYIVGKHRKKDFLSHDLIVKNPAVPLSVLKGVKTPITNDADIFMRLVPREKVIGITGTKGKTTTAHLIAHYIKAPVVGVPGTSFLDVFFMKKLPKYIVAEFSSFDCELLTISPHIAVITSLFGDHLNRYKGMREYFSAKKRLFKFQTKDDIAFMPKKLSFPCKGRRVFTPMKCKAPWYIYPASAAIASSVAKELGYTPKLKGFKPPKGRREIILDNGIMAVNDTIATNPVAAYETLLAINKKKKIIAIVGGVDKKFPKKDTEKFNELLKEHAKAVFVLPGDLKVDGVEVKSIKECMPYIKQIIRKGDVVALIPGTASTNIFVNGDQRGEEFSRLMKRYL